MPNAANEFLCFAEFSLDLSGCVLLRDNQPVPLRPKAFDMLRYLAEHPHQLATKQALLEALWPEVWVTEDSIVQCVRAIRLALGDQEHRLIRTLPRRGYVFVADVARVVSAAPEQVPVVIPKQPPTVPFVASPILSPTSRGAALWMGGIALMLIFAVLGSAFYWWPDAQATVAAPLIGPSPVNTAGISAPVVPVIATERRTALVVGNGSYGSGDLTNARRDASAVAEAFRNVGFASVVLLQDPPRQVLLAALEEFALTSQDADWAVVYYAGRGVEVSGAQFLLPVDTAPAGTDAMQAEAVALTSLLRSTTAARRLRLVIFDACRIGSAGASRLPDLSGYTFPATGTARNGATLIAFSTAQGRQAEDGPGHSGPYAEALLAAMNEPGLEIDSAFRLVRDRVLQATEGRQEPFLYGSLPTIPLYFRPP